MWNQAAADTVTATGTVPIIYINTEDGREIDQKVEYIPATC